MLMMTAYLVQQQKQKLMSIQNMSVCVCNIVNMFNTYNILFLLLLCLVKHSVIAADNVTTQSISE